MADTFAALKALRSEVAELRADSSAAGEALAAILHHLDASERCLRVILRMVRHLHSASAMRKVRRRAVHSSRRASKP